MSTPRCWLQTEVELGQLTGEHDMAVFLAYGISQNIPLRLLLEAGRLLRALHLGIITMTALCCVGR